MMNRPRLMRVAALTGLCMAVAGFAGADSIMWIETATIARGGNSTVRLFVASDTDLSGVNAKLQLPTGISISSVSSGSSMPGSFVTAFSNGANGEANVLGYSASESFSSVNGTAVLRITLSATNSAPIGNFALQIVESRERDINTFQVLTPRAISAVHGDDPVAHTSMNGLLSIQSSSGVLIPDAALKVIVETQCRQQLGLAPNAPIGIPELQHPDFKSVVDTYTGAGGLQPVKNLSGLEYCTSLEDMELQFHEFSDLQPIQGLNALKSIRLSNNRIVSISALTGKTNVTLLNLRDNRIWDISPLSTVPNLRVLRLDRNEVSNLSAVASLSALEVASFDGNFIGDISAFAGLSALKDLTLDNNLVEGLNAFSASLVPEKLSMKRNRITDLSPLATNANSVAEVGAGDVLAFDGNPLSAASCDVIQELLNLGVNITPNQAGCLDPTIEFASSALRNAIRDALNDEFGSGFAGNTIEISEIGLLTSLTMNNNGVTSLEGLQHAVNLKTLIASNLGLTDITPILGLTQLEVLRLGSNDLTDSDLVGLANLVNLKELRLNNMGISRMDFVQFMPKLEVLIVGSNRISDVSPIRHLTRLNVFRVNNNLVSDISACVSNGALGAYDTLFLQDNPLGSQAICVDLPLLYARPFANLQPAEGTYACEGDRFEPDDSPLLARRIFLNESHVERSLVNTGNGADEDWLKFELPQSTSIVFEAAPSRLDERDLSFVIEIFRDDGPGKEPWPLLQGINRQPGVLPAGNYLVRIHEAANTGVGDYVAFLAADLSEPADNSQSDGPVVQLGEPHINHTLPDQDIDWYRLTLSGSQSFIQMRTNTVYGQTLPELFGPDDPTDLHPATFSSDDDTQFFNNLSPGQYWIRVRDFPDLSEWNYRHKSGPRITQSYSLRVDPQTVPDKFEDDDSSARATSLEFGPQPDGSGAIKQSHNFHDFGDTDWYKFLATDPNVNPVFAVTDLGSRAFPVIDVFAADATTLLASGVGTVELNVAQVGLGKFFVRIRNANPGIFGNDTAYGAEATQGTQATAIMYGTVYNDTNGQPVANASVRVLAPFPDPELLFEPTDAAGTYAIQGVPVDLYDVEISASGFQTSLQSADVKSILLEDSVFDWRLVPNNAAAPTDVVYVAFGTPGGGNGTIERPLNSIVTAVQQVKSGGTIILLPGASGESIILSKPMLLLASGPIPAVIGSGPMPKAAAPDILPLYMTQAEQAAAQDAVMDEDSGPDHDANHDQSYPGDDPDASADGEGDSGGGALVDAAGPAAKVVEPALPFLDVIGGLRASNETSALAIRLRSHSNIDPETIWGPVFGYESGNIEMSWQQAAPGDMRDIWVVYEPSESWFLEDVLRVAVNAKTVSGETVSSGSFAFQVESAEQQAARIGAPQLPLPQPATDPDSGETNSDVLEDEPGLFAILPDAVYEKPHRVWIPLPGDAENPKIFYYHPHGEDRGWYPAGQVEDWLVADSTVEVTYDNQRFLGFLVRHAGIVQLVFEE